MPDQDNEEKHIQKLKPEDSHKKGCVTKHETSFKNDRCSYRYNGYQECSGVRKKKNLYEIDFTKDENSRRLPYLYKEFKIGTSDKDDPANWRYADNPVEDRQAWCFSRPQNFKTAYLPYNHNYHHILPFTSLKQLEYDELDVLQESGYNLNDRINMIILPSLDSYGIALKLPAHPYGHTKYNKSVKSIVEEVKQDVERNTPNHKISEDIKSFKDKLESWEKRQFDEIVKYGKKLARKEDPENPSEPNQINQSPMAAAIPTG